ncbi:MAG: hypothetical protein GY714_24045 [Desulfobacterales bacterium]|nr:hypothetical protein [Desulfobacterales bacterium]MCP4163583.1 hypothetical protein [Deltaproteobacteria bacterium]
MTQDLYKIKYEFNFKEIEQKVYEIIINTRDMNIVYPEMKNKPDWTKLEYEQCKCCPYTQDKVPYCPIAVNIAELVSEFKDIVSFEDCVVKCTTNERTYLKKVDVQDGLYSILGLINATSACSVINIFKPMARFHLPFSTVEETIVRATSFYLLRQYFKSKKGGKPDFDLKDLENYYGKIQILNEGLLARIDKISKTDADKNAMVILHSLSQMFSFSIDDSLSSVEFLFEGNI